MLSQRPSIVILTGTRHDEHLCVSIDDRIAGLRCSLLQLLVELVLARADTDSGWVEASPTNIHLLRHALDQAGGTGTGMRLIETGVGKEYRITIAKEDLADHFAVTKCFFELQGRKIITAEQAARIRELFRIVPLPSPVARSASEGWPEIPSLALRAKVPRRPKKSRGNRKKIKKKSKGN